jgi:hypothetical protein
MSQADDIRQFVISTYIEPARARGDQRVTVRAGDVHRDMNLDNALAAVCSAIGSTKFLTEANVRQVGRDGPAAGSAVLFTFEFGQSSVFDVSAAETILRSRYGEADVDNSKIVSFALPDGRSIALQRDIAPVQVWMEDEKRLDAPPAAHVKSYAAGDGRHSNLPDRLKHEPSMKLREQGFPRPAVSVRFQDQQELIKVLDWYEQKGGNIDRGALEALKNAFLVSFPDFKGLGFEASEGRYWDTERGYKQHLIDRAQEILAKHREENDATLGDELLNLLVSSESNLLGWRMVNRLREVRDANQSLVERQAGLLVRSALEPPAAVEEFVRMVWPVYSLGQDGNMPYRDIRTIPTMLLALAKPGDAIGVRYQPIHTAGVRLLRRSLFKNAPFSGLEYRDILSMSEAIANIMRHDWGWQPRDLWDVQGFIWATCNGPAKGHEPDSKKVEAVEAQSSAIVTAPTNLILYGPPGTGKTYRTAAEAVLLCDGSLPEGGRPAIMARYNALKEAERIAFVTFHQSYSYEDFVEGLRPETGSTEEGDTTASGGFQLKPVDGIFKRIATLAKEAKTAQPSGSAFDLEGRNFFKMSLGRAADQSEIYKAALEGNYIALGWGGDIDWSDPDYNSYGAILEKWRSIEPGISGNRGDVAQTYRLRVTMREGDIVIISDGNSQFRAVGEITGPYEYVPDASEFRHRRKVRWLRVLDKSLPTDTILDSKFTQMSLYLIDPAKVKRGALQSLLGDQEADAGTPSGPPNSYVLIIDEINRANISKVFGELITLIEVDKRLGGDNALTVTLPYSKEPFGVPANLHIIGTMNTADRSIALLDTALRRRFEFRELMPQSNLLENVDGIDVGAVLTALNDRIEYLFDREHQIGHAYFMSCRTRGDVDRVVRTKVIPLLTEYFYEDWEKVRQVLGETEDEGGFISRRKLLPPKGGSVDYNMERWRYSVRDHFADDAYSRLLA